MKRIATFLLIALPGAFAAAQTPSPAAKPAARAVIEGIVTKDPGSEPVKKALIELIAENQAEGGDYTAVTGADGTFHIAGILPGRYHLFAERTGLLEVEKHRARTDGRVLNLAAGQEVKDLAIRLQAAAVVRGRVTDEDGDPMPNGQVAVLRQTYVSGRSRWEQAGSERTNDLGEYRIANLAAGSYYVSVSPPPDFKSLIETAGAAALEPRSSGAAGKADMAYQQTYYPGTVDRGQAAPIQLRAGDDFPVNFSLAPSPSLSIRGSVVNLPPRASPSIMVRSRDFALVQGTDLRPDGSFVLRDVSPGAYTVMATAESGAVAMMARQSVQVTGRSIEGLRLALQPGASIRGRLRLETGGSGGRLDPSRIFLTLHAADGDDDDDGVLPFGVAEASAHLAQVAPDGSFEFTGVPPGNYYVQLEESAGNSDWFLKSAVTAGGEASEAGINVNGGTIALDLLASTGGVVEGTVSSKDGSPVANAVVVAVPDPHLRGRADRYRKTVSDQAGRFTLRGVPPGEYTLFAWEGVDGEAYLNAEFLKSYEAQGSALRVGAGERKSLQLVVIPEAVEQP